MGMIEDITIQLMLVASLLTVWGCVDTCTHAFGEQSVAIWKGTTTLLWIVLMLCPFA